MMNDRSTSDCPSQFFANFARTIVPARVVVVMLLITLADADTADADASELVKITLRPDATVAVDQSVRISDIAVIQDGDALTRARIAVLDVHGPLEPGKPVDITPRRVFYRIRIAGVQPDRFHLFGAKTHVGLAGDDSSPAPAATADADSSWERVVGFARTYIEKSLPDNWEVKVRSVSGRPRSLPAVGKTAKLSGRLRSPWPPLGRVQVAVSLREDRQDVPVEVLVSLDVTRIQDVVVARQALPRGHIVTPADVYVDRREFNAITHHAAAPAQVVGRQVVREIKPLHLFGSNDVAAPKSAKSEIVVKPRDRVRLIARSGGLSLEVSTEAMQPGRRGEVIRLRNVQSGKYVYGRVTGPNQAAAL